MSRLLRQSTAFTFRIGPFLDDSDGVTAETGLTINQADIQLSKDGGAFAQTSDAAPTTTHDTDGWYQCPLTTTDTNTLGPLTVQIVISGALPVWEHFMVISANVYDSLVDASDNLQVDTTQIEGSDATDQIRDAVIDDATRLDGSAINGLSANDPGSQLAAQSDVTALNDFDPANDTVANVTTVGTCTTNSDMRGTDSALLAASAPTNFGDLAITVTTGQVTVGTNNDKTGYDLNANQGSVTIGTCTTNTDMRGTDSAALAATALTNATWTDARAGYLDNLNIGEDVAGVSDISGLNDLSAAQVNAEIVDALNIDTYAEPGQGAPPATNSIVSKLSYMYKTWRNKKDNDGTTLQIYNDAGDTVDQKTTVSSIGGTVTSGEIVSGP
jgi:hypothetical protein